MDEPAQNVLRAPLLSALCGCAPSCSQALLTALNKLPKKWRLEIEQEANREDGIEDFVLNAELEAMQEDCDEHADVSFLHELVADFEPFAEVEQDNVKCPSLHPISPRLAKQLEEYKAFRTANLNRLRTGTKVVDVTFESEKSTLLRFLGWCKTVHEIAEPTMDVLRSDEVGKTVEAYAQWLEGRQLAWSSITNYLSGIINAAQFACCELEEMPDLSQLGNLRSQTAKMAEEANLYKRKSDNWIDWEDVQRTRVACVKAYNAASPTMKQAILKDCLIIHLHSVTPPGNAVRAHLNRLMIL